jgi:uncharacterized protein (DUF885 family)
MSEAAAFDALAREFFSVWFRFHPDAALQAGVGDFGNLLPAQSDDDHAALASWLETLIVALEELNYAALDGPRQIDLELMFSLARVEHRDLLEHDWRHRDPLRFLPLEEIHRLTLLRPQGMRDALASLLGGVPEHLRLAIAQLMPMAELVPPVLAVAASEQAEQGRTYLRELARSRWLRNHCHGCAELESLAEQAGDALAGYAAALRRSILPRAAGAAGCGSAYLRFLLRHRHLLDIDPEACAPLLEELGERCDAELAQAGAPTQSAHAPQGAAVREVVRDTCRSMAERLQARQLVTLPQARLRIGGGPVCPLPRTGPTDYVLDLHSAEGRLYLADGNDCGAHPQPVDLRLRCLSQGWGGDHLFAFSGGMQARSVSRRLAAGATLADGWTLYLDARLFADGDPDEWRAALRRRRHAINAAAVDLALHSGVIDARTASTRLQDAVTEAGAGDGATSELARLVQHPGDALAAVLGWQLLEAARARYEAGPPPAAVRIFHDRLLSQGPIPLSLALRQVYGEAFWGQVRQTLPEAAAPTHHHIPDDGA